MMLQEYRCFLGGTPRIAVSSANVDIWVLLFVGISEVNIKYKKGPSMLPCGTPAVIGWGELRKSPSFRINFR